MTPQPALRVLDRLAHVSTSRGAPDLGERLANLDRFVRGALIEFEAELKTIPQGPRAVQLAAHHLLDLKGKHLRPLCVALASRFGEGFTPRARGLALAVELVHTATLLHDDVVDLADRRRGRPAARVIYGNAASIFAGDWLLVAALRRIAAAGVDGLLDRMLGVIDEMILAESIQLERRGTLASTAELRDAYFKVVEGKTAALFRWAMVAGARVAGMSPAEEAAIERYGLHLGVAFQAIDDELDFADTTGKDPFADLREGKITYPLVIALEREPALRTRIERAITSDQTIDLTDAARSELQAIALAVRETGALLATRKLAEEHVDQALAALAELPPGPSRDALTTVALASLERTS
ncbi:MAG: polyprenyl synthetase family protein [Deltaproteobacteria bacterium]|nr:polyprenyl synthetase family protein [Deltaproteobacteria bacterium]